MYNFSDNNILVKGEEGAPILTIEKSILGETSVKAGQTNINYQIIIDNIGELTAYEVVLNDSLPEGLVFSGTDKAYRAWEAVNIAPNESKTYTYQVDVLGTAKSGVYTNLAVASALNHDPISDSADLNVKGISILGAELTPTGFSPREFIILLGLAFIAFVGAEIVRRKAFDKKVLTKNQD